MMRSRAAAIATPIVAWLALGSTPAKAQTAGPAVAPAQVPPGYPTTGYPATGYPATGAPEAGYVPGVATSGPTSGPRNADDESKDSGLGLEWAWIDADIGGSFAGLDSVNQSNLSLQNTKSGGGAFAFGAGVRLFALTVGVRARDLQLSAFNLWEIGGEAALHARIGHLDPYFGLRGGYAFVGTLSSSALESAEQPSASEVKIHGFNAGFMAGIDYYFNHFVSLGVDANPEFLFLQRPKVAIPPGLPASVQMAVESSPLYQQSGTSIGFAFTATAHVGVHF
ncbi:MAG: hypothetical protein ABSC94_22480 [Polyangiaceae bacterium]|jgi:hypothetical protein